MNLPSYFKDFLAEIEPSPSYKDDMRNGHITLRKRLAADADFKVIHVNTFLQGSYKRNTAIHPGKDVDIVVVTTLNPATTTPAEANAKLGSCLRKYYKNVEAQTRSFGVTLSYVAMDVVIAASQHLAGSALTLSSFRLAEAIENASEWKEHTLLIPDRDLGRWVETHPKRQMEWTTELNVGCGGFFVPLVKIFKWWRKETYQQPKYPKGYVLERLAEDCVDRSIRDHAEGFVRLLENIYSKYSMYATTGLVPNLADPGVPSHNVAHRLNAADFKTFIERVAVALPTARAALSETDIARSADLWQKLFGVKFPAAATPRASFPDAPVRPNKPAGFA